MTTLGAHMWISYSPDLRHWGRHRLMLEARRGAWWDANKIGLSPPPIETSRGWLVFYHGVRHTPSGCLYRLGLALFDLRIRKNACCEEIRGYSGQKPSTSAMGTLTTSCSPADTPWTQMVTLSIFITEPPIVRLPWLGPAFALYSSGSMPTEVVSAASVLTIDASRPNG